MTTDIEGRIADALTARTAHITADSGSLVALRGRLRQPRRTSSSRAAVAAAALGAVAVAATATGGALLSGPDTPPPGPADGRLSTAPFPASAHFVAVADGGNAVVRASDGQTAALLPEPDGVRLREPVLSPDGSRAYGTWTTGGADAAGYLDLQSGRLVELDRGPGLYGATLSADGNTLAYERIDDPDRPEASTSVVVVDLDSDRRTVLAGAPAGPQVLTMALSPDGRRLAVVPTRDGGVRPLVLVATDDPAAFSRRQTVAEIFCSGDDLPSTARFDQPRWTASGLYVLAECPDASSRLAVVDAETDLAVARPLQDLAQTGTVRFTAVERDRVGPVFVVSDETRPDVPDVAVLDPQDGWSRRPVDGVTGLAVPASQ